MVELPAYIRRVPGSIPGVPILQRSHNCIGAGRLMSRMKAKETIRMSDYSYSMDGIYTTSVSEKTIDEAPMAYKSIDEIVECIGDTVDILAILKPIYNFKASE